MTTNALRRLIDLPGIAAIEQQEYVFKHGGYRWLDHDDPSPELFGIDKAQARHFLDTAYHHFDHDGESIEDDDDGDQASGWDAFYADRRWRLVNDIVYGRPEEQVLEFRKLGWDVTDDFGRPLLCLSHFAAQLAVAALGLVGKPMGNNSEVSARVWGADLEKQIAAFIKDKRKA